MDDSRLGTTLWPDWGHLKSKTISYAQNFEDVRLARVFPGGEGFYIDIGAYESTYHSVTKWFYDRGWRGVNVEPQPEIFARLAADRPRDVNLNAGAGRSPGELTFYQNPHRPERSSFRPDVAADALQRGDRIVERRLPVVTLAEICARHVGDAGGFEFLKIDAEGFERATLEGNDWDRWRPRVVLYEDFPPDETAGFLAAQGYTFAAFDGVNKFYVRDEDRALIPELSRPVSVLDDVIPYTYLRLLDEYADVGPNSLAVARRLKGLGRRFPAAAAMARKWLLKTA